jgi:transposase-like protein
VSRAGRKPQGWKLIDGLAGDRQCKARLKAFLQTLTGESTVDEVCAELGIGPSRFFVLRNAWLQEAVDLLGPKPVGRPRETSNEPPATELKQQLQELKQQLLGAELRAKLAEAGVLRPLKPKRKKGVRR